MRMLPTHYASKAVPAKTKKDPGHLKNLTAPLRGLSMAVSGAEGDQQTALVLKNFIIEEDRITCRDGYIKKATRGALPVEHLIPHYARAALAAASNHEIWNAQNGTLIRAGFTSDDWHWTAYSNLGDKEYVVMVNGADGVWSWDGTFTADGPAKTVTSLSAATEAVCTVAAADIATFHNGDRVIIAGADTAHAAANGPHYIKSVGVPANTFTLIGVNTASAGSAQTTGVTARVVGAMVKETITVDPADTFISPNSFEIVLAHQNRLFFADGSNLAVYYLPLFQKDGLISYLPMNNVFKRGGYIKAMYTWTVEGGTSMNDQLVVFSSNGECAIYGGVDPDSDFPLTGVFRFDAPMSKHSVVNWGGDLYVMISTGLMPMSTLLKAEGEQLGLNDQRVKQRFMEHKLEHDEPGWSVTMLPNLGVALANLPHSGAHYHQMLRYMSSGFWTEWADIPGRCWAWIDPFVYFGDDAGNVYEMHPAHQTDNGREIRVDMLLAWTRFGTAANKQFKGVRTYLITDGNPKPVVDVKTNFDYSPGVNVPDFTEYGDVSMWDAAHWDTSYWAGGSAAVIKWNGVAADGIYGAVRLTADVLNCKFSVTGFDVLFEEGFFGSP
jgi:hypothetical protein